MMRVDRAVAAPTNSQAQTAATTAASAAAPANTDGLTPDEVQYLQQGLLPENYGKLKQIMASQGADAAIAYARKGLKGPFSPRFGDPRAMLDFAHSMQVRSEFKRLYGDVRKGDILLIAMDAQGSSDVVQKFSKGPYDHALICTSDSVPPQFIEAIGLTGDAKDPSSNQVRRASAADYTWDRFSIRLMRPVAGMPEPARSESINRAVAFAEAQLGKPYDYTFLGSQTGKSYYCSDLVYMAYTQGAGMTFPLNKSGDRDAAVAALKGLIQTLKPHDETALGVKAMQLMTSNPSQDQLLDFIVKQVMPHCDATATLAGTPDRQARLKATINKVIQGQAFPRFDAACKAYQAAAQRGEFAKPIIGKVNELAFRSEISAAMVQDAMHLSDDSGAKRGETVKTAWTLLKGIMPYADTLADVAFGPQDPRSKSVHGLMDQMDWLSGRAHAVPLLGKLYPLPGRARTAPVTELISPSDLAWSPFWHLDYNVKPNLPLDPPKRR